MDDFKVALHKNAKNVEQIEDYWVRRLRALERRSGKALAYADLQYLIETGREEESILSTLQEKNSAWQPYVMASNKARLADGDLTLHSKLYPVKEQADVPQIS